jgi:ribosome-dependent ATPase
VLKGFSAIVYKEMVQIRRDPASLVLALAIPLLQLTIFGYAIDTEIRDIPTVVLDLSRTEASRRVMDTLRATDVFATTDYVFEQEALWTAVRRGAAKVAITIPEDFADHLVRGESSPIQVLIDGSDSNLALQAQATALQAIGALNARIAQRMSDRAGGAPRFEPSIEVRPRFLYNPDQRSEAFFVPGLAAIILQLVTMILTSFAIVRERERGTLEQILVTPISKGALLAGKLLPFLVVGALEALFVALAMVFVFRVPIQGSVLELALAATLFLFCSLALGLFISTVAKTQIQAMLLSFAVLLPSVLLSGFMFPCESMPAPIRAVTYVLPSTYFVEIVRGMVLRGASARDLQGAILPLCALSAALVILGLARFRRRLA